MSPTQLQIARSILLQEYSRNIIITPTQFGKSFVVALAVLYSAAIAGKRWIITAPSEKKARITMNYINEHIFDSPVFYSQLDVESAKERLKKEASKKRITFRRGGEVSILSLDARNSKRNVEAAMGHGAQNICLDESALIDDVLYASVKRMLGGHAKNFLIEISNPFYRNHFYRTWEHDSNYHKVYANYETALAEGRFTPEFIEEMRKEALFDVFYECKFPDENAFDAEGYRQLIATDAIKEAKQPHSGALRLGVDVGAGGDETTFILRSDTFAEVIDHFRVKDTMVTVQKVVEWRDQYSKKNEQFFKDNPAIKPLEDHNITIDDIGIGHGVSDRLIEMGLNITKVNVGMTAEEKDKFLNLKAELAWKMKQWLEHKDHAVFGTNLREQCTWYKFKVHSDKVIQIEAKEDLKKRTGGKSPDFAEGLLLTFYEVEPPAVRFL